jgi:uncharacterized protein
MGKTDPNQGRGLRRLRLAAFLTLGLIWAGALGWPLLLGALGGAWGGDLTEWRSQLSSRARELADAALEGVDLSRRIDSHVHIAGVGTGGSGCRVNEHMRSMAHPVEFTRFQLYLSAAGVEDLERADQEFIERLDELTESMPQGARFALLAFDAHHDEAGVIDEAATEFYVPNEYVWQLSQRFPERYLPVISVHPYRADAREEVERWAERGVKVMKWLPNAMGIDPLSPRCDAVYEVMAEHGMLLLSHTGEEKAVEAEEDQELGNPLRLRRALDHGVRVLAAHCASLGTNVDLDDPDRAERSSMELFLRMMDEERYEGLLFGEVSGMTLMTRVGPALETMLEREDLHARLVDGSDYPLPAMNVAISLGQLSGAGFIDEEDELALGELYRAHPLVFDLALKRCLRSPGSGKRFGPQVFEFPEELGL